MKYHSRLSLFREYLIFLLFFLSLFFFFFISSFEDKSLPSQEISREIGEPKNCLEKISLIGVYLFSSRLRAPRDALRTSRPN